MGLSADEKTLLEQLTAKAKEPDAEDFEIEIYDTNAGRGARLPFSKGAKWLFEAFGIGDAPAAAAGEGGAAGGDAPPAGGAEGSGHFFGRG